MTGAGDGGGASNMNAGALLRGGDRLMKFKSSTDQKDDSGVFI